MPPASRVSATTAKRLLLEIITLSSPRGRLLCFGGLSAAIYVSRYHWLDHLSLWGDLGLSHVPSIGLTRAYWLLLHGQPVAAWHRNWLIYVVLAVGIPLLAADVAAVVAGRRPSRLPRWLHRSPRPAPLVAAKRSQT